MLFTAKILVTHPIDRKIETQKPTSPTSRNSERFSHPRATDLGDKHKRFNWLQRCGNPCGNFLSAPCFFNGNSFWRCGNHFVLQSPVIHPCSRVESKWGWKASSGPVRHARKTVGLQYYISPCIPSVPHLLRSSTINSITHILQIDGTSSTYT
jgi:hypothetical protein